MKGEFKPTKKKETPIGELTQQRKNHAVISGKLAGACDQIQDAARIATETAERARAILTTPELRAYLLSAEVAALEAVAGNCERARGILRADYHPLYAIEQRVRRIGTPDVPPSGDSPAPKKKSLTATARKP